MVPKNIIVRRCSKNKGNKYLNSLGQISSMRKKIFKTEALRRTGLIFGIFIVQDAIILTIFLPHSVVSQYLPL